MMLMPDVALDILLPAVLAGSLVGARRLAGAATRPLRLLFAAVVGVLAIEMIAGGLRGGF